ncbi:unnamed protein product, partial [Didymodactylos carnosus]
DMFNTYLDTYSSTLRKAYSAYVQEANNNNNNDENDDDGNDTNLDDAEEDETPRAIDNEKLS